MPNSTTATATNALSDDPDGGGVQDIIPNNTNATPIGIDTVRIHLNDFAIDDTADFNIHEKSDYATGETQSVPLWESASGTVITGDRATLNMCLFQVTVRSVDFMSVQASLPKLLHGNNVRPATAPEHVQQALNALEDRLAQHGIECSLSGRPLSRVDICRNVRTDTPMADLKPLLKRLDAPYLQPRDNGHEGVKWASLQSRRSERAVTFYSKSKEADLPDPHVQRLEYRLQRKRTVQSKLGDCTTDDLCESLSAVRAAFREIVTELFPDPLDSDDGDSGSSERKAPSGDDPDKGSGQITSDQIRQLLREIRSEHGEDCHALSRALWPLLLAIHPNPDRLEKALERAAASEDGPSKGKYQVRRKTRQARPHVQALSEDLYVSNERLQRLRAKLLS